MKKQLLLIALLIIITPLLFAQTEYRVNIYNGPGNDVDQPHSVTTDLSGNTYVTGSSIGSNTSEDFATVKYNSSGVQQWVARYNGTGSNIDMAYGIAVDNAGNVYVTGWAYTEPALLLCGTPDYITIKYNSAGVQQWLKKYDGAAGNDYAYAIAIDAQSNVYVTGASIASNGKEDYATVKYNSAGVQQWAVRYDGPSHNIDIANKIIADRYGNVYVTGSSVQTGAGTDYVTVKYNSAGVQQWVARYNGTGNGDDIPYAIGIDNGGNVVVTGSSKGSGTNADYVTVKYSPAGTQTWVTRFNGAGSGIDEARALIVDAYSYIYVTGYSYISGQDYNYVTFKYDPDGVVQWSKAYNSSGNGLDKAWDISVSRHNCMLDEDSPCFYFKVFVTGQSQNNYLTVCYDESGTEQWIKTYNSTNSGVDIPSSIIVKDGCDTVIVTGISNNNYCTVTYYPVKNTDLSGKKEIISDKLEQNYPNPFNPSTTISFITSSQGTAEIAVFDITGREVTRFTDIANNKGRYSVTWNAESMTSGVYFYTLQLNGILIDKKIMILLK